MDKFGIKGTLYDLLGYVIPGALFLLGLFFLHVNKDGGAFFETIKKFASVKVSVAFGCGMLVCAYTIGHILASIGSVLFENRLVKWIFSNEYARIIYKINEEKEGEAYAERFHALLGANSHFSFRDVFAYSQEQAKHVYDTSFVFLSIYGFSRNVSVAMLILFAIHSIWGDSWTTSFYVAYFVSFAALLHNYFRFKQYYIAQTYASLSASKSD